MSFTSAEVWEQFNQEIIGYIRRRVADPDDAEDLAQEVFVKVHARLDRIRLIAKRSKVAYSAGAAKITPAAVELLPFRV